MKHVGSLIAFLIVTASAAAFGAAFGPGSWYDEIAKPGWTPPDWLFGPVWTLLYAMIAIAGWRLWTRRARPALALWVVQLVLNALWSWIFFGLHNLGLAFADIALLWLAIVATIVLARRPDPWAAGLLVPYLLWVTFAAALNFSIWQMNSIG
ncbi:MAG: TspO/MBR family protein [Acidobacteriota bacterium]